ncbi:EnvZ/OmpR regulon moderator MzrA [Pseudescherichia vulneris]|uniref:EnvZ/OmpR regulon moderator MzrA n=1 Tax=Pseudescherichia vulneris TaxID=566 RepID=UPI00227A1164|nr:EnvZ/OmpR regulon moderator MzrA [Pseudescherichia vulneris]WAH54476.1 EnvZ/OmpR regulon moderator MzrA [Pseudescherichia vulneris]
MHQCAFALATIMLFTLLFSAWVTLQQRESTLAIRPGNQSVSVPDGFSVWHHLDANGIRFKSITPKNDTLVITFDSSAQSAAAKVVLDRTLPQGYIIALQDDDDQTSAWLTRLRNTPHRLG